MHDLQFMDVLYEVEAHDAEILSIEYSDPSSSKADFGFTKCSNEIATTYIFVRSLFDGNLQQGQVDSCV